MRRAPSGLRTYAAMEEKREAEQTAQADVAAELQQRIAALELGERRPTQLQRVACRCSL
jgi:hypothetical protein